MRYSISPLRERAGNGETAIQFGDVLYQVGDGPTSRQAPHGTPHLVVQKGRLFQQAHPDVPVLLDKGRYLVVDLDPERAKVLDHGDEPCYSIQPMPEHGVVFDHVAPRASRGAGLPWVRALVNGITRGPYEEDFKRLTAFPTRSPAVHITGPLPNLSRRNSRFLDIRRACRPSR
jgi:hypothetical protein